MRTKLLYTVEWQPTDFGPSHGYTVKGRRRAARLIDKKVREDVEGYVLVKVCLVSLGSGRDHSQAIEWVRKIGYFKSGKDFLMRVT